MNKLTGIILLILIFILALAVRFVDLSTHFAHYDDVFISTDALRAQDPSFREQLLITLYDQSRPHYADNQKVIIRRIYEDPRTRFIFDSALYLAKFLIVPVDCVTAPIYPTLTALTVSPQHSYRLHLFLARLPSFIFSLLTFYLLLLILRRKIDTPSLIFSLLIYALALSSVINAKLACSYALGCLAATGLLLLAQQSTKENFWPKHWLMSGILTTLAVYAHYQSVFLLPAYYLTGLFYQRKEFKLICRSGFLNLVLCLPALVLLLILHDGAGIAIYTRGLNGEFLFNPAGSGLWYPVIFFLRNSFLVIANMFSPVTSDKWVFWLFGLFFYVTFWYGLLKIRKQPEFIYIILCFLVYLGLVFTKTQSMSPTRHALVYLPILLYPIAHSLNSLPKKRLFYFAIFVYLAATLWFLPGMVRERRDPIKEADLVSLLEKYNPDLIVGYVNTMHLALFPAVRQKYNYIDSDHNLILNKSTNDFKTVAFFSTWEALNADNFTKAQDYWNKQTKTPWQTPYQNYKIVYTKISTSNIEYEPNYWNTNGKNNLFFYILQKK